MKKLIELLNECKPAISCANFKEHYEFIDDDIYLIREGIDGEEEHFPMYVCYKKGEFIKWLVDNDKIDRPKFFDAVSDYCEDLVPYPANESLLMLLSISNSPINDLISYLK